VIIENYSFGKIKILNKLYTEDVKILGTKVIPSWRRKEGHKLYPEDIEDILSFEPEVIVVGTGSPGLMSVQDEVKQLCEEKEISLISCPTEEAVEIFNKLSEEGKKIAGCFHLTC